MNRQPFEKPPRWWPPKLSPWWVWFWRPLRLRKQLKEQRLLEVEVRGLEHVREPVARGQGVLITPNHAGHADCYAFYTAADQLGYPFYVMIAWQNFTRDGRLKQLVIRQHGGFSVDREGTDMRAFRQAVEILQSRPNPLIIFPEGEVYHLNERITPFREGPAAIALVAARKASRPIVCVPCGIKYRYVQDPTPELLQVMEKLERAIFWRPRPDLALATRIYHFAEGVLALKEIEFLGHTCSGPVRKRVSDLADFILGQIEARYGLDPCGATVPERVKLLRQRAIEQLENLPDGDQRRGQYEEDLDDLFLVVQAFSYPGDYVEERPTVERMAETLDKFEEDVLGNPTATVRGARAATVTFGEPIPVESSGRGKKAAVSALTRTLEERVQSLLDEGSEAAGSGAAGSGY